MEKTQQYETFVGKAFEELNSEEMKMIQGSGEISPLTSIPCLESAVLSWEVASILFCGA